MTACNVCFTESAAESGGGWESGVGEGRTPCPLLAPAPRTNPITTTLTPRLTCQEVTCCDCYDSTYKRIHNT